MQPAPAAFPQNLTYQLCFRPFSIYISSPGNTVPLPAAAKPAPTDTDRLTTMRRFLFCLALCAIGIALQPASAAADLLAGLSWSTPEQLREIAAAVPRVRFVARNKVLVSGDADLLRQLQARGFEPFFAEEYAPDDAHFLVAYRHCPLHPDAHPSYVDPDGWALLRLRPGDETYQLPHFLYRLPETYSIRGWLPQPRPKPAAGLDAASMEEILARVDPRRLERDIRTLSLKNPDAPSDYANRRTRFTVRPETFESTQYIRRQLAAVLGEQAVQIQEFTVDEDRLSAHLRDQLGEGPIDLTAHNVVGVLPGTDPEAGYYIICGHYDATGVRTAHWNWRTDPAPGADDNATGAALVLESARVLAGQQFPWSIRFIAFSGEELGLLGSRAYAATAADSGAAILGILNFDMFGYNDLTDRVELATNPASRWLADQMVDTSTRYGLGLRVDVLEDEAARLSDHAPFWARGYDAILAIENYLPTDSTTAGARQGLYRLNNQYHTVADLPDSINWNLVAKTTQLAVATLARYTLGTGLPNLAVFTGDLKFDGLATLRLQVGNIGGSPLDDPFQVRLSHCGADSLDCETIYTGERPAGLKPGEVAVIPIPWKNLGENLFLLEVDPGDRIAEGQEGDNRVFQRLYLQPRDRIVVYPNPYQPDKDDFLIFAGLPFKTWARILSMDGELVWKAQEDDQNQRIEFRAYPNEVRWDGLNQDRIPVEEGKYLYELTTSEGEFIEEGEIVILDRIGQHLGKQIHVFPNPFHLGKDQFLHFSKLRFGDRVQIFTLTGELVWSEVKKYQGTSGREIRWSGTNQNGFVVNSGVYIYTITSTDGQLLERDKFAVIRYAPSR